MTPDDNILSEHYFTAREGAEGATGGGGTYPAELGLLTICVLIRCHGAPVTGQSICTRPETFDPAAERNQARRDAMQKLDRVQELSFGQALDALKRGDRVARAGWNGKSMWLALSCDGSREVPAENFWSPHNAAFARENGGAAIVQPCITMKNAQGQIQMGWNATQSDMLATDWYVVGSEQ